MPAPLLCQESRSGPRLLESSGIVKGAQSFRFSALLEIMWRPKLDPLVKYQWDAGHVADNFLE